jgi:hypothetical protein
MPQMRKLAVEEVQAMENKDKTQRKLVEEQYDAILSEFAGGDYGEATLEPGENRLTVRNRLRAAARRRNLDMEFRRTSLDLIRFRVVEHANGAHTNGVQEIGVPEVVSSDIPPAAPPAPKKRGSRPKKTA